MNGNAPLAAVVGCGMSAIESIALLLYLAAICIAMPGCFVYFGAPHLWPWGMRGGAARQLRALEEWRSADLYSRPAGLRDLCAKASGYFAVGDYLGGEGAYLAARRIVDGESEGK